MHRPSGTQSYYELLNVGPAAGRAEIEASYKQLMDNLDLDSVAFYSITEDVDPDALRAEIIEAYKTLCDPRLRAAYDRLVSGGDDLDDYPAMVIPVGNLADLIGPAAGAPTEPDVDLRSPPLPSEPSRLARPRAPQPRRRFVPQLAIAMREDTEFSGALLRTLRESAGATLEDLSELTKISRHYLTAIEENDFAALPAPVYVRGFVSQYAQAFGLDAPLVTRSYMALYNRYLRGSRDQH